MVRILFNVSHSFISFCPKNQTASKKAWQKLVLRTGAEIGFFFFRPLWVTESESERGMR